VASTVAPHTMHRLAARLEGSGIVLLDMIVIAPQVGLYAVWLFPLFLLALLLQRIIPAT